MKSSTESEETNPEVTRKLDMVLATVKKALKQIRQESGVEKTNYIQRISLNLEFNKMEMMLTNLSKGYFVKKHSPSTSQYHEKYLYISEDHRFLCWKSLDKNDQKMIELRKIDALIIGLDCKGMLQSKTVSDIERCFLVMSDARNLQIQCNNIDQLFQITIQLQQALKNSKRMHLSYRF